MKCTKCNQEMSNMADNSAMFCSKCGAYQELKPIHSTATIEVEDNKAIVPIVEKTVTKKEFGNDFFTTKNIVAGIVVVIIILGNGYLFIRDKYFVDEQINGSNETPNTSSRSSPKLYSTENISKYAECAVAYSLGNAFAGLTSLQGGTDMSEMWRGLSLSWQQTTIAMGEKKGMSKKDTENIIAREAKAVKAATSQSGPLSMVKYMGEKSDACFKMLEADPELKSIFYSF